MGVSGRQWELVGGNGSYLEIGGFMGIIGVTPCHRASLAVGNSWTHKAGLTHLSQVCSLRSSVMQCVPYCYN